MTPQEAWSRVKEAKYFYILLALVGLIAIGLLLLTKSILLHKLAEALIIATFLAGTVDVYLRSRFAKEVAKDISPFVMAYAIPSELRDEVAEICRIEYYRSDFVIRHELVEQPGDSASLLLKTKVTYCVNNLMDHHVPYTHYLWAEKSTGRGLGKHIGQVGADRVCDLNKHPLSYNEDGQSSAVESPEGFFWKRQILLPPKGNPVPNFWHSYYQVVSLERYEPFITSVATVGAELRVKHPEWLEVQVEFKHRLGGDVRHWEEDATTSVWEFKHALLPFSVIATAWQPRADR